MCLRMFVVVTSMFLFCEWANACMAQSSNDQRKNPESVETLDMTAGKTEILRLIPRTQAEMLDRSAAREYMLRLINRDRARVGVPPVSLDNIASKAAQEHSDEMALHGYGSHWGMDGRKPDQRYTEAGGRDSDSENIMTPAFRLIHEIFSKQTTQNQEYARLWLDADESALFGEEPPRDGHRRNIIDPAHTEVGIGLSLSRSGLCCAQEFINHYGEYSGIPHTIRRGEKFTLTGKLYKNVHLRWIQLTREGFPKPLTVAELNNTDSYGVPYAAVVVYQQESGSLTLQTSTDGCDEFSVDISTHQDWKPGLYYVMVFATIDQANLTDTISTRTFRLDP